MKKYVFIVLFFLLGSCVKRTVLWEHDYISSLKEAEHFLGEENCSHFPSKSANIQSTTLNAPAGTYANGFMGFFVCSTFEEKDVDDLIRNVVSIQNPQDSCMPIVHYLEWNSDKADSNFIAWQKENCRNFLFPVPNFSMYKKEGYANKQRLSGDFTLYLLEAKKGVYCEEEYKTEGEGLPKEWRNGISKGIAISRQRKIAIYWLAIW